MFDMITWICQHKFGNISTVKMPIAMSGKSKIDWNWGAVHVEGVYLYLSKKNFLMHAKIGKYLKLATNNQMPYIMNHELKIWNTLLKKAV